MRKVIMKQMPDVDEIPIEIIAQHVAKLADVGRVLKNSRLKERAILLLLRDITRLGIEDIQKVLDALELLEAKYLKPLPKKKA